MLCFFRTHDLGDLRRVEVRIYAAREFRLVFSTSRTVITDYSAFAR